jgi:chemotaxis protein methyltransferase CheR
MKEDSSFIEQLIKDITVNTTELFRDPSIWQHLRYRILPRYADNKQINIWHAGCSTGQEVYSMLILLNEMGLYEKASVYASDINSDVLTYSEKGIYKYRFNIGYLDNFDKVIRENPYNYEEYNEVPYTKYMTIDKNKDIIVMKDFLKNKVVYKKHDLVKSNNAFFVKFDIIMCRNVIIYFNYKLQNAVFKFFHDNLYDEGLLILGKQETIRGGFASYFERSGQVYSKRSMLTI